MKKSVKACFNMWMIKLFGYIQVFPSPLCVILWGSTHYKIKGPEMRVILNALQPGDILLRRYDRFVSGWFIPGYYVHAALFVGNNQIIHATTHDIFPEDILTFLRADEVAVLRIRNLDPKDVENAISLAKSVVGHGYDFDFGHSDGRFYCTSVVRWCFPKHFKGLGKGGKTIVPDDYFYQDVNVIHDSRSYREQFA